jgi:hypothetical protein
MTTTAGCITAIGSDRRATARTGRLNAAAPARVQQSSSARMYGLTGSSPFSEASPINTPRACGGTGREALRPSEPLDGPPAAKAHAVLQSPLRCRTSASAGSSTSSTVASTERSASDTSIARSASSARKAISAGTSARPSAPMALEADADRGGDREAVLERVPQRRDLGVQVEPVAPG